MATTAEKVKSDVTVQPFGIEADHPRNADLLIQCIPGLRLRTAIGAGKTVKDSRTGTEMIPTGQSAYLGQFPPIPGQQLHVNPAQLSYVILDPLHEDEALCDKIRSAMNRLGPTHINGKLQGVPPQKGTLDVHRMKSLVREMLWLLEADEAKACKGSAPSMEDVKGMPGKFLLNPGSRVFNTQPMYEEDYEAWVDRLSRSGG